MPVSPFRQSTQQTARPSSPLNNRVNEDNNRKPSDHCKGADTQKRPLPPTTAPVASPAPASDIWMSIPAAAKPDRGTPPNATGNNNMPESPPRCKPVNEQ